MANPKVRKRENFDEDDSNRFAIIIVLINAEKPMTLSEIAREIDLRSNLVFYHLKCLKEHHLILKTDDKRYTCQPFMIGNAAEDLGELMMLMVKIIVRELARENPTEKILSEAVIENLRMYMKIFEIEIE